MTAIQQLQQQVKKLSPQEFYAFFQWMADYDFARWDEEIERDVAMGKLDALIREAKEDIRKGRTQPL